MTGIPVLDLGPDPRERGLVHGRAARAAVADNVETYLDRFAAAGLGPDRALALGAEWIERIAAFDAEYAAEMAGVAEGAGQPLDRIAMLNVRYELAYGVFADEAAATPALDVDGCTAFAALPEATRTGETLIGQNWDWLARVRGRLLALRVRPATGPAFLTITQAGIVGGMMGLNEAGIGLCVNGLISDRDGRHPHQKPFHLRVREILRQASFMRALAVILSSFRVGSTNWLLGHADGEAIDLETAPDAHGVLHPQDGILVHANHFERAAGVQSLLERTGTSTLYRAERFRRGMRQANAPLDVATLKRLLSDHFGHPYAICRHPDPADDPAHQTVTAASVILALNQRVIHVADGPPCETPYQAVPLAG